MLLTSGASGALMAFLLEGTWYDFTSADLLCTSAVRAKSINFLAFSRLRAPLMMLAEPIS
jgi:hypothetical protein